MNTPRWLFFVLVLWLLATVWSNALEPAQPDLLPSSIESTSKRMADPSLTTVTGLPRIWDWITNLWKALTFDYAWFDGWAIGTILRAICTMFTVTSLYLIADIIWKIRTILLGQ